MRLAVLQRTDVDRGRCQWRLWWDTGRVKVLITNIHMHCRGDLGSTFGAGSAPDFNVCFYFYFCFFVFLSRQMLICERNKNKAHVELLQLRTPPNAKKKKKNLLEQNQDVRERLIHCLYSKIPPFRKPLSRATCSFRSSPTKASHTDTTQIQDGYILECT